MLHLAIMAMLATGLVAVLCLAIRILFAPSAISLLYWSLSHFALAIGGAILTLHIYWHPLPIILLGVAALMQQIFAWFLLYGVRSQLGLSADWRQAVLFSLLCTVVSFGFYANLPSMRAAPAFGMQAALLAFAGLLMIRLQRSRLYGFIGILLLLRAANSLVFLVFAVMQGESATPVWPVLASMVVNLLSGIGLALLHLDEMQRANLAAEREKLDALALLRTVIDTIPAIVHFKDTELRHVMMNNYARTMFAEYTSDPIGKRFSDIADTPAVAMVETSDRRVLRSGMPEDFAESPWTYPSGRQVIWWVTKVPLRSDEGMVRGVVTVALDITRLKEAEARLIDGMQVAERANRAKSSFLANMSHELRTPLNAIIGFAEMLSAGYGGAVNEKQQAYVQNIHTSGQHLLALVNDILDLSRIDAGRQKLEPETLSLDEIFTEAVSMTRPAADAEHVQLIYSPTNLQCHADRRALMQILLNLLSNAVKFNRPGGSITLEARSDGDSVMIAVSDTGIGMSESEQARAFQPFERGEAFMVRTKAGAGLGLAIVKSLVELHNGKLRLQSRPGHGTRIEIHLPGKA